MVSGSCDCTTIDSYPLKAIPPGGKGKINITFDTTEKELGAAMSGAIIISNALPKVFEAKFKAIIEP